MARRHKRLWTNEEKRSICHQTQAPGVSVAQVARRYAVNANLIFKWLRDPRFAPEPELVVETVAVDGTDADPRPMQFLPVELVSEPSDVGDADDATDGLKSDAISDVTGMIEIELSGGHRLRITGAYDPDALARLLRGLSA